MEEDQMKKLYEIFENYEITSDILNDINKVQTMIEDNNYDKDFVINLESKYSVESMFLMDLEHSQKTNNIGFDDNYEDPDLQVLINLRDRLYIIGVYKILKEEGREITKEIIDGNFGDLVKLVDKL